MSWDQCYLSLYERCLDRYQSGERDFLQYYTEEDLQFLSSIGCKPRELFDFVEDIADAGEPARSTALLVAAVRRDYFLVIQNSQHSELEITARDLPTFGDKLEGMEYLPRIITKARHKLRGELDPDIMYGCGGDRNFLKKHGEIPLADFLRQVWAAGDDDAKIAAYVRAQS